MPVLAQKDEQPEGNGFGCTASGEDLSRLTNDRNTEDTPDLEMGGPFHCPRKSEKENKPSVSPDPFEETLEDEKGSLDSKGSS